MQTFTRSAMCAALLAALTFFIHQAILHGLAGERFQAQARDIWALRKQHGLNGRYPPAATLAAMEAESRASLVSLPSFGAQWINQVLIARTLREAPDGAVVENLPLAHDAVRAALVRMPHSPIAWAEYALILDLKQSQNQLDGGTAEVQAAMRRALALGPRESNMVLVMLDLGFRNWDDLLPETRTALSRAIAALPSRHGDALWQIALRRGRAAELCADVVMRTQAGCAKLLAPPTDAATTPEQNR